MPIFAKYQQCILIFSFSNTGKQLGELSEREFQRLFTEMYSSIRNYLYFKLGDVDTAEDLAQDTFVKLWENRKKIDSRTVKPFLYTIAGNLAINFLKRRQLQYRFLSEGGENFTRFSPEKELILKEYGDKVMSVIAELPEGSREVFLMNRLEDLKYKEISERLGISVKAVEKRMSKALQIIRRRLNLEL